MILFASLRVAAPFLIGFGVALGAAPLERALGPEAGLLDRVNEVRRSHRLEPLARSRPLAVVARQHAEDMAQRRYLSHVDLEGRNPLERAQAAGVEGFRLLAENIGASSVRGDRVQAVVGEWLRSEAHRENLLNPAFNSSGIGVATAPDGATIFVELYATF